MTENEKKSRDEHSEQILTDMPTDLPKVEDDGEDAALEGISLPKDEVSSECLRIQELEKEVQSLKEKVLLARADMDNMRRSCVKQVEDAVKYGASNLAKDMISFVDNLERAVQAVPKRDFSEEIQSFIKGVQMTASDILTQLEKHGIKKMKTDGCPFDPEFHQAVSQVESEGQASGTIVQTLQTGYTLNGRLLRAAMVTVAK